MPDLGSRAARYPAADSVDEEVEPVAELGQRIAQREVVVVGPRLRDEDRCERAETARESARITRRRAAPHVDEVPRIAEPPAAADAHAICGDRWHIAVNRQ